VWKAFLKLQGSIFGAQPAPAVRDNTVYISIQPTLMCNLKVSFMPASQKLLELLNKGIARELQVSIQYMWQHVQVTGMDGVVVEDVFRKIAIAEMKHAERLAERLDYLNGVPTTKPDPIFVGGSLIEMLKQDEQNEEEAITLYKQAIQVASEEGDYTTRRLLEEILAEEEEHINTFGKLLVGMTEPFTQPEIS
jgi:bacterioferritin